MTIDERIERLTERHETLAQIVELISLQIRDLSANQAKTTENIAKVVRVIGRDAERTR